MAHIIPRLRDNRFYFNRKRAVRINDTVQNLKTIKILSSRKMRDFLSVQSKFRRLQKFWLKNVSINESITALNKATLGKGKELLIQNCLIDGDLHASLLAFCSNIKRLVLLNSNSGSASLPQKDPSLKAVSFNVSGNTVCCVNEIIPFLKLNQKIQTISVSFLNNLSENIYSLFEAKLELEVLMITRLQISNYGLKTIMCFLTDDYACIS